MGNTVGEAENAETGMVLKVPLGKRILTQTNADQKGFTQMDPGKPLREPIGGRRILARP
jgi:hypothetical protein